MPHQGLSMNRNDIKNAIYQIANVYPILPIVINTEIEPVQFMPKHKELWWTSHPRLDHNGCVVDKHPQVGKALSMDRVGKPLAAFTEFYIAESEDHLDPAIEHFDGIPGMSFHDAVNQMNVY